MKYDYLVVGSGLYGAIFAHEAKKHGKRVLVIDKRPNIAGNIYTEKVAGIIVKRSKESMFINMELIFSIQTIRKCGITLHNLQSLIVLQTVRLQIIKGNYIHYLLICTHLIKCGVL